MSINTRHALHPLALAVTLALAACGGNQDTPQTSAPGPQTKADTGLPATTLDTADTPAAAQTSASGRATKAVATADTPPLSENRKMLRGDVLIQALLSRTARLDAQNNPQTAWLSPETYTWGSLGAGQQGSKPSVVRGAGQPGHPSHRREHRRSGSSLLSVRDQSGAPPAHQ